MNNSCDILDHEQFLIFGAARSGLAVARLLKAKGKRVAIYDEAPPEKLTAAMKAAKEMAVPLLGEIGELGFPNGWEVMVLSPGIPTTHPLVELAEGYGCVVRSEIEIAFMASPAPVIAITGTNGKTTVTNLVTHLLNHAGRPAVMGGNVGRPLSDAILDPTMKLPGAIVVCEVSSYQLETIERFHPIVAAVLNITPDHLDRYGAMENYAESKRRISENQTGKDTLVVNGDDRFTLSFLARSRARGMQFSLVRPVDYGAYLAGDVLKMNLGSGAFSILHCNEIPLPGRHNIANVLAALCMGAALGLDPDTMAKAVCTFQAVAHRIEPVCEINGVRYFNDSKATNLDSMQKALESFPPRNSETPRPCVILIAGGRDKGAPWTVLNNLVRQTVKGLVAMGEAAPIALTAWGNIVGEAHEATDMEDAITQAKEMATPGDVILLSPGCASFDMYTNFEERGEHFKKIVMKISAGQKQSTTAAGKGS